MILSVYLNVEQLVIATGGPPPSPPKNSEAMDADYVALMNELEVYS